jgi:hypothetical protein
MLNRTIEWWAQCEPSDIAQMTEATIEDALLDAKKDILWLNKMLKLALQAEENAMTKVCDLEDQNAELDKALRKSADEKTILY